MEEAAPGLDAPAFGAALLVVSVGDGVSVVGASISAELCADIGAVRIGAVYRGRG